MSDKGRSAIVTGGASGIGAAIAARLTNAGVQVHSFDVAGDGNDHVDSGAGNDHVLGGKGDDEISGDNGNDFLDGGDGDDVIHGGDGNDILRGGKGADTLSGDAGILLDPDDVAGFTDAIARPRVLVAPG